MMNAPAAAELGDVNEAVNARGQGDKSTELGQPGNISEWLEPSGQVLANSIQGSAMVSL